MQTNKPMVSFKLSQSRKEDDKIFEKGMRNKKIDLIQDESTAKLFEELIGSKWEIEVLGTFFNFVRYIRISDSCGLMKTNFQIWKVNAGFEYVDNYKEKYKNNNSIV